MTIYRCASYEICQCPECNGLLVWFIRRDELAWCEDCGIAW